MTQNTINRVCRTCGKSFTVTESHLKGQQRAYGDNACAFCSLSCVANRPRAPKRRGVWEERVCQQCGTPFHVTPSRMRKGINKSGEQAYRCCSKTCSRRLDGHERGVWEDRTCQQCGGTFRFNRCPTKVAGGRGLYCSKDCYTASMSGERIISHCVKCGKEIKSHPSAVRKYCSRECAGIALNQITLICQRCGKPYEVHKSREATSNYCSRPCQWEAMGERMKKHGDAKRARLVSKPWARRRQECIDRDGGTCVVCGTTDDLTAHHIIPWVISEDDELDNLMTLCRSCHMQVEPMGKHSQWRDLIWLL